MRLKQQVLTHNGFELVPFMPDDLQLYIRLVSDPVVMQHIGPAISEQDAERFFREILEHKIQQNYYYWSVRNSSGNKVGLAALITEEAGVAEFGLMLLPEYCFQGYSVPILAGLINFAFMQWHLNKVTAKHQIGNVAAPGLLKRLSVKQVSIEDVYWFWQLDRADWLELKLKPPYINFNG
jgi:RimJ/RimL family protein N-acetyltransferase